MTQTQRKFKVTLTADARVSATVDVEAASEADARYKAIQHAREGNASWNYDGVNDFTIETGGMAELCHKCGSRWSQGDIDGGRCLACGTSIAAAR